MAETDAAYSPDRDPSEATPGVAPRPAPYRWGYFQGAVIIPLALLGFIGSLADLVKNHRQPWPLSAISLIMALVGFPLGVGLLKKKRYALNLLYVMLGLSVLLVAVKLPIAITHFTDASDNGSAFPEAELLLVSAIIHNLLPQASNAIPLNPINGSQVPTHALIENWPKTALLEETHEIRHRWDSICPFDTMAVRYAENQMAVPSAAQTTIPRWTKWAALAWLLLWFPIYWHVWGPKNFLQMCDIAVILTCFGLWTNSSLLISSQAVSALLVCVAWTFDAGWRFLLHHHLIGGTEYLFDASEPLWIRLLSLYHLVLPALLLWLLYRLGYDKRGWALQSAIALPVFIASRFTSPQKNMNFAFADSFFHRQWGPAPVHILVIWLFHGFRRLHAHTSIPGTSVCAAETHEQPCERLNPNSATAR